MSVETLIRDGRLHYICETCSGMNLLSPPKTECPECGAWYRIEIEQESPGVEA